jgi:DNA-binding response OmpR family regulator
MPVMDGPEAYRAIGEISDSVPVVLISGHEPDELVGSFGPSTRLDFVQKPFLPRELVTKIRAFDDALS